MASPSVHPQDDPAPPLRAEWSDRTEWPEKSLPDGDAPAAAAAGDRLGLFKWLWMKL